MPIKRGGRNSRGHSLNPLFELCWVS